MTYQEPVYRFRVMRQLNDRLRNPNGDWSLIYSTRSEDDAEREATRQRKIWGDLGDKIIVVDFGKDTFITREVY
ncbi:MAG TPA: hypothetical protein VFM18_18905 [Methanosarcina sp.]|nr:hypothetical protein [Methanosarcina sp.]